MNAKPSKSRGLQKTSLWLLIAAHITLLIGIYQYFTSAVGYKLIQNNGFSAVMKDSVMRFWAVEHISGMLLAIKSDLRVGLRGTRAGITEVKMGRGSPWAVPLLWMLPQPVVMELVLTGETMPIERLAEHGFLNYLEDTPDAVRARALQLARGIADGAPLSIKAAKASVLAAMDLGCADGLVEAARLHVETYASLDAIEGPKAFAEKRKPVWQGK